MKLFYLNHFLPKSQKTHDIIDSLDKTLREYKELKAKYDNDIDGIITNKEKEILTLGDEITLQTCIESLPTRDLKIFAYKQFTKYPFENYFTDIEDNIADISEYCFNIESTNFEGFYFKIVHDKGGILFSLDLHTVLKSNIIKVSDEKNTSYDIPNLYGHQDNTTYIETIITDTIKSKLENIDKLQSSFNFKMSQKFINTFNKKPRSVQDEIINGFEKIRNYKLNKEPIPETLLRDVTPTKELTYNVKELKIRDPEAIRVYFYENEKGEFHLASLEKKPLKDRKTTEQAIHIKNALSTIKQTFYKK